MMRARQSQRRRHRAGSSAGNVRRAAGDHCHYQLAATGGRFALCTMCIGVGQGIAVILERV